MSRSSANILYFLCVEPDCCTNERLTIADQTCELCTALLESVIRKTFEMLKCTCTATLIHGNWYQKPVYTIADINILVLIAYMYCYHCYQEDIDYNLL